MANDQTVAPVIIKRKKIIAADGHHGGAWKVAYADFVTAMMAFFMLMWLLNATTEQQKKGIADYFSPTLAINCSSGGGDSSFVGDTVLTEETLTRQGVGASTIYPTESAGSRGATGLDDDGSEESKVFQEVIDRLSMQSGESAETDNIMKHIATKRYSRSTHDNARKYSYYAGRWRGLENLRGKHGNYQRPDAVINSWRDLHNQNINCLCRL